jgi:hypothetical protein
MTAALRSANSLARRGALWPLVCVLAVAAFASEDPNDPWVDRFEPFGGQIGTTVAVELTGKNLTAPLRVEFDTPHLIWESGEAVSDSKLSGRIRIESQAALGPHIATLITSSGRANSRLFYVDAFPSSAEAEPNDLIEQAQTIELKPQTLQGAMHELVDIDYFKLKARAGERWTFDLRSLEYGGYLENDLALLDSAGVRVAFSDDRDDYLETPFLEYTFDKAGHYYLKLDQYRGPQRVNCAKNCGYMLRISQLPVVEAAYPLGARVGTTVELSLRGRALGSIEEAYLTPVRGAEYYRLTFPYTIPVKAASDSSARIAANMLTCADSECRFTLEIPSDAPEGLWRIWTRGPNGVDDRLSFEISSRLEADSTTLRPTAMGGVSANGSLDHDGDEDAYTIKVRAGQPIVVTTLAAQLGLPYIDTVLELFDSEGKLVAEHDDLMSGQGTVIGNPDSLLRYTPDSAGAFKLVVRDRIGRGGPSFVYRLRVEERLPGFALLSDPENLNLRAGSTEHMGVLLVREPGFDEAVDVWVEGLPAGITATQGSFREDQFFGPSGDGDNVIIPEVFLDLTIAENVTPGDYAIRVLGRVPGRAAVIEAISTLWIGPPRKRNDIRRPLPSILLTVLNVQEESPAPRK